MIAPDILVRTRLLQLRDMRQVEPFLLGLDVRDRHARFGLAVSDWWIGAYAARLDPDRLVLAGGFAADRLVALAEAHPAPSAGTVEVAVAVHASRRRLGVGTNLVLMAMEEAFARGARAAGFTFGEDPALTGFMASLGATMDASRGHAVIGAVAGRAVMREVA